MARRPARLKVSISIEAQRDLGRIWRYNRDVYGTAHANEYIAFLAKETDKLATISHRG